MKIFISHSNQDSKIAKALIDVIRNSINLPSDEIRCTSVDGYRLPIGSHTDDKLRSEIFDCDILIGLISTSSMDSHYVLFELGARWGAKKTIFPIICSEGGFNLMNGPLNTINALDGTVIDQVYQFVRDLSNKLELTTESVEIYNEYVLNFSRVCLNNKSSQEDKSEDLTEIETLLKKNTYCIRGVNCDYLSIFKSTMKNFSIGTYAGDLWWPIHSVPIDVDKNAPENDEEDAKNIIGELMIFDIVQEVRAVAKYAPKYYLTEFGKMLALKIKKEL